MLKYIKFMFMPVLLFSTLVGIILGGPWLCLGLAVVSVTVIIGDLLLSEDLSEPKFGNTWILNIVLYMAVPFMAIFMISLAWSVADTDLLSIGAAVQNLTGYDALSARAGNTWWGYTALFTLYGMGIAGYATNVAHELTHRTTNPLALTMGRWLLALSNNADFSIEHVYGHHLRIGTEKDPATARRGENVYTFIVRSTIGSFISAWDIEAKRLERKGRRLYGPHNLVLRGFAMSLVIYAGFFLAAGWTGVAVFALVSLWGKTLLEVINYVEHYGLVRVEGQPVMPRHSWNTNTRVSSMILFSLTRHSAHHEKGDLPFWVLKPYRDAPTMRYGYLATVVVSLIPFWWRHSMTPLLNHWDQVHATKAELEIIKKHNAASNWPGLTTISV